MTCCCNKDGRIIIVRNNDTDFNGGKLVEFHITSDVLTVGDFKAVIKLSSVSKEYDDLSSGIIDYNLTKEETLTLPFGAINGTIDFIDKNNKVCTFSTVLPFYVTADVDNNAITTSSVEYTINVKQGNENIFNIDVKSAVSVSVGTVETLSPNEQAYVQNVGTNNALVLNFGIPRGDKGDTGETGEAATIQIGTVTTLSPSQPAYVENVGTEENAIFNFGIPKGEKGDVEGQVQSDWTQTDNTKVDYIKNKPTIPTKTSDLSNDSGFITSSALSGYATETWVGQQGYITGITYLMVTTALGYTPYNSSNPNNYQENVIETIKVNGSSLTPSNKAVDITVPSEVTENTVSGWGFTKNTGTVTSVNNVSPVGGNVSIDLSGYQTTSNLVTSVSSASTDGQYPSAKCLYDLCGDIETLINAL